MITLPPKLVISSKALYLSLFCLSLSGCSRYSFEVNNNQIYTPPPIYTDYSLDDKGLEGCILQVIEDNEITKATDLTQLKCSYAGVLSLNEISQFSRIEQLSLKGNPIVDGSELLKLTYLTFLDISETKILDCQLINQLSNLLNSSNPPKDSFIHSTNC